MPGRTFRPARPTVQRVGPSVRALVRRGLSAAVAVVVGLAAAAPGVGSTPRSGLAAASVAIVIDGSSTYQRWDGWGLSISGLPWEWTVRHYLNQLPDDEVRRLQDSLFGPGGYTLAIVYSPIWAGPSGDVREGYAPRPFQDDTSGYDWDGFRMLYTSGDPAPFAAPGEPGYTAATYRAIVDLQRYGTTLIFNAGDFPSWIRDESGRVAPELEPAFVTYVTAFPVFVRQQLGYTFSDMIIVNEPDLTLRTSPEQQRRLLGMTRDRLRAEGLPTQLVAPSTATLERGQQYGAAVLADASLAQDVSVLATHAYSTRWYDSGGAGAMRALADAAGKRLWLTEFTDAPDLGLARADPEDTIERAVSWASRVQRDLTEMQVNAWFGLYPVLEPGHYPADGLVIMEPNDADPTQNRWYFTRRYFALAHYTRFIRPGAVRLRADAEPTGIRVVAFQDPTTQATSLVAVNDGRSDVAVQVRFDNLVVGPLLVYRTSGSENLDCLGAVEPNGTGLVLPARSVTTLVGTPSSTAPSCPG